MQTNNKRNKIYYHKKTAINLCKIITEGAKTNSCLNECVCTYKVDNVTAISRIEINRRYVIKKAEFQCFNNTEMPSLVRAITRLQITDSIYKIKIIDEEFVEKVPNIVELQLINVGLEEIQTNTLLRLQFLEELNLSNNPIQLLHPATFKGTLHLKTLTLENCRLKVITSHIFQTMRALETLNLAGNNLTSIENASNTDALATEHYIEIIDTTENRLYLPPKIKYLNISSNRFSGLIAVQSSSLQQLNICDNHLRGLQKNKTKLPNVKNICLGGDQFKLHQSLLSSESFPKMAALKLKGTPKSRMELIKSVERDLRALLASGQLLYLHIDMCILSTGRLATQPDGSHCKVLKITNSDLNNSTMFTRFQPTQPTIFDASTVDTIDLTGTQFLASAFLNPPKHLRGKQIFPKLTTLILTNTMTRNFPQDIMQHNPELKILDISQNPLHCTCENYGWIYGFVALNKLKLNNIQDTKCETPDIYKGQLLIEQELCNTNNTVEENEINNEYSNDSATSVSDSTEKLPNFQLNNSYDINLRYNDDNNLTWEPVIYAIATFFSVAAICTTIIKGFRMRREGRLNLSSVEE